MALWSRLFGKKEPTHDIVGAQRAAHPSCANCGRTHGASSGFGGMVDRCGGCGKPICRSCKKLEGFQQSCPMCGATSWSTI